MAPTFILVSLVYSKLCIDFTHVTTPLQQNKSLSFLISQLVYFSMAFCSFSQKIFITMLKPRHLYSYYSCVPGHIMSLKMEGFICDYFCFSLICFPNCLSLQFSSTPQSRESSFINYSYIKLYTSSFILDQWALLRNGRSCWGLVSSGKTWWKQKKKKPGKDNYQLKDVQY